MTKLIFEIKPNLQICEWLSYLVLDDWQCNFLYILLTRILILIPCVFFFIFLTQAYLTIHKTFKQVNISNIKIDDISLELVEFIERDEAEFYKNLICTVQKIYKENNQKIHQKATLLGKTISYLPKMICCLMCAFTFLIIFYLFS